MKKGKTYLIMKKTNEGLQTGNFQPITYLPIMWKLLSGILADYIASISRSTESDSRRTKRLQADVSRGCKEQLLIAM